MKGLLRHFKMRGGVQYSLQYIQPILSIMIIVLNDMCDTHGDLILWNIRMHYSYSEKSCFMHCCCLTLFLEALMTFPGLLCSGFTLLWQQHCFECSVSYHLCCLTSGEGASTLSSPLQSCWWKLRVDGLGRDRKKEGGSEDGALAHWAQTPPGCQHCTQVKRK